jgi:dCTP deaminase
MRELIEQAHRRADEREPQTAQDATGAGLRSVDDPHPTNVKPQVTPWHGPTGLLSDRDLIAALVAKQVSVDPMEPAQLQPSSIDVRLDYDFRAFRSHASTQVIDPAQEQELTDPVTPAPGEPFVLHPGQFVLGSTYEEVGLGNQVAARLEGKSSLGRLGLLTHSTAGFIDPGFRGHVTLELSNVATLPILLWPGMRIGQLAVFGLSSPVLHLYGSTAAGSHYQGQRGPTPSRSWRGFTSFSHPRRENP